MNGERRSFLPHAAMVGVAEIDTEHEALHARLAAIKSSSLAGQAMTANVAEALLADFDRHFFNEAEHARKLAIDFTEHAAQHRLMLQTISRMLHEVVEGRADIFGVLRYLDYWLERHAAADDRLFGAVAAGEATWHPGSPADGRRSAPD
jgi:hemerythrin-like metal-binding protein